MTGDRNPHAEQMADESMVRTLAAQADAIWPQEQRLLERYDLPPSPRVVDVGCGTGQITARIAELLPEAALLGVDLLEDHLERARLRCTDFGQRVLFQQGDAYALELPDGAFDLTLCRHLLQAVPEPRRILHELLRITKPGGVIHLLVEDYGMIHFHPTRLDTEAFFRDGPQAVGRHGNTDMHIGRRIYTELKELGLQAVRLDYVVVDPVRVPRRDFVRIWEAWRDGYTDLIAEASRFSREEVWAHWEDMIACLQDPNGYGVWLVPVASGIKPRS